MPIKTITGQRNILGSFKRSALRICLAAVGGMLVMVGVAGVMAPQSSSLAAAAGNSVYLMIAGAQLFVGLISLGAACSRKSENHLIGLLAVTALSMFSGLIYLVLGILLLSGIVVKGAVIYFVLAVMTSTLYVLASAIVSTATVQRATLELIEEKTKT